MTTSSSASSADWLSALLKFAYTQNPFYLVGTFLVLFGLQQCLGNGPNLAASGLLVSLLALYTLLLAGMAVVIIRYGRVWDDARTILLVIVLQFFMLSASLDVVLLEAPLLGTCLLSAGLLFSIGLSEGLLRSLRIGLAAQYRGPYYAMLGLLFLHPIATAWVSYYALYSARTCAIYGFPTLAALALLTLLPAARTRGEDEPATGTPWRWPFYPWSLFVFLTLGFIIRSWWVTISFEAILGEDSCFRPFFLLPIALAWSALLLEMGKARDSLVTQGIGLVLPLLGLFLGFPGEGSTKLEASLYSGLAASIGSPPQLAVWSLLAFYAWAWLRKAAVAEVFVIGLALLASVVGRQTFDWQTLAQPQPMVVAFVAGSVLALAISRKSTWRAVLCGLMAVAAARFSGTHVGSGLWFWQWHAPLLAFLAIAAIFNDDLARFLRQLAWRVAPALAVVAAIVYPWVMPGLTESALASYLALLLCMSIALWQREKEVAPLGASFLTLTANLLAHSRHLYLLLGQTVLADGLPWLTAGLTLVTIAFLISLLKMGLWPWTLRWLEKVNLTLSGSEVQRE
ncbi:MAG: hypothetical protein K8R36_25100 [Planctomycetales bacterium]|nr:hypothetical protein [Planctomycetales bacterium]